MDMSQWVEAYRKLGLSVIPLKEKSKEPNLPTWKQYQKTPPTNDQIQQWLQQNRFENIGILTGKTSGNLHVIDFDDPNIIQELGLNLKSIENSGCWVIKTGRGLQVYIKHNGQSQNNKINPLLKVDFKGEGGYVVAPPSIHPNGQQYRFNNGYSQPSELPRLRPMDALQQYNNITQELQTIKGIPSTAPMPPAKHYNELEADCIRNLLLGVQKGARNEATYIYTKWLKNKKLSREESLSLVKQWNQKNQPPQNNQRLQKTFNSAWSDNKKPGCNKIQQLQLCPYTDRHQCRYYQPETKTKRELLQQYQVFEYAQGSDNIQHIYYPRLAKLIMQEEGNRYIAIDDNEQIWVHSGDYYKPNGEPLIKNRVSYYLEDNSTKFAKQETVDFIRNFRYITRDELNPPKHLINLKLSLIHI